MSINLDPQSIMEAGQEQGKNSNRKESSQIRVGEGLAPPSAVAFSSRSLAHPVNVWNTCCGPGRDQGARDTANLMEV